MAIDRPVCNGVLFVCVIKDFYPGYLLKSFCSLFSGSSHLTGEEATVSKKIADQMENIIDIR